MYLGNTMPQDKWPLAATKSDKANFSTKVKAKIIDLSVIQKDLISG